MNARITAKKVFQARMLLNKAADYGTSMGMVAASAAMLMYAALSGAAPVVLAGVILVGRALVFAQTMVSNRENVSFRLGVKSLVKQALIGVGLAGLVLVLPWTAYVQAGLFLLVATVGGGLVMIGVPNARQTITHAEKYPLDRPKYDKLRTFGFNGRLAVAFADRFAELDPDQLPALSKNDLAVLSHKTTKVRKATKNAMIGNVPEGAEGKDLSASDDGVAKHFDTIDSEADEFVADAVLRLVDDPTCSNFEQVHHASMLLQDVVDTFVFATTTVTLTKDDSHKVDLHPKAVEVLSELAPLQLQFRDATYEVDVSTDVGTLTLAIAPIVDAEVDADAVLT